MRNRMIIKKKTRLLKSGLRDVEIKKYGMILVGETLRQNRM